MSGSGNSNFSSSPSTAVTGVPTYFNATTPSPLNLTNATLTSSNGTAADRSDIVPAVSLSVFMSILLGIVLLIHLCIRSKHRDTALRIHRRCVKLDAFDEVVLADEKKAEIIKLSREALQCRITDPPQYDRVLPSIIQDGEDWKATCFAMLKELRSALVPLFGAQARRMSMRTAVWSIAQLLDPQEVERFLRTFEAVLLGIHQGDGTEGDVVKEELRAMQLFYQTTLLKEVEQAMARPPGI
jgi:hypothetical protein